MTPKFYRLEGISVVDPRTAPPSTGPKWCRLFPGATTRFRHDFPKEGISFDGQVFSSFIANWQALGQPKLPVDYGHDEKGIAAGWVVDLAIDSSGALVAAIEWTDRARAAISAHELEYLSPTFAMDCMSPLTGKPQGPTLYGAALLNTPFLQDLPPVTAAREAPASTKPKGKTTMELMKKLASIYRLADTATEDEICAAAAAAMKPAEPAATPPVAPPEASAPEAPAAPMLAEDETKRAESMRAAIELAAEPMRVNLARVEAERLALEKKCAALEAEKLQTAIGELVRVSLARGVAAAQEKVEQVFKLTGSLESTRAVVAMIPGTVTLGELGHNEAPTADDAASASEKLNKLALEIHRTEGISMSDAHLTAMRRHTNLTKLISSK